MKTRWKAALSAVIGASLVLSACGGNTDSPAPAAVEQAAPAVAEEVDQKVAEETVAEAPGSEGQTSADAGLWNVCSLLKAEEVSSALGVQVAPTEGSETTCDWMVAGADASTWNSPRLHVSMSSGGASSLGSAVGAMEEMGGKPLRKLNVGDDGYEDGTVALFHVGDAYAQMLVTFTDGDFTSPAYQELAQKLASRL